MIGDVLIRARRTAAVVLEPRTGAHPSRRGWANQKHGALRASCYLVPTVIPKYAAVVKSLVQVAYRGVRLVLPS